MFGTSIGYTVTGAISLVYAPPTLAHLLGSHHFINGRSA